MLVNGAVADKPARLVAAGDAVVVAGPPPRFVGRGGEKLDAALDAFAIDVAGRRALDAGASTGGFTDCLLQRGAAEVVASTSATASCTSACAPTRGCAILERTNIRDVTPATIGGPVDIVVADLSFISLTRGHPACSCRCASLGADGAARQAAVRGRSRRGQPRARA